MPEQFPIQTPEIVPEPTDMVEFLRAEGTVISMYGESGTIDEILEKGSRECDHLKKMMEDPDFQQKLNAPLAKVYEASGRVVPDSIKERFAVQSTETKPKPSEAKPVAKKEAETLVQAPTLQAPETIDQKLRLEPETESAANEASIDEPVAQQGGGPVMGGPETETSDLPELTPALAVEAPVQSQKRDVAPSIGTAPSVPIQPQEIAVRNPEVEEISGESNDTYEVEAMSENDEWLPIAIQDVEPVAGPIQILETEPGLEATLATVTLPVSNISAEGFEMPAEQSAPESTPVVALFEEDVQFVISAIIEEGPAEVAEPVRELLTVIEAVTDRLVVLIQTERDDSPEAEQIEAVLEEYFETLYRLAGRELDEPERRRLIRAIYEKAEQIQVVDTEQPFDESMRERLYDEQAGFGQGVTPLHEQATKLARFIMQLGGLQLNAA